MHNPLNTLEFCVFNKCLKSFTLSKFPLLDNILEFSWKAACNMRHVHLNALQNCFLSVAYLNNKGLRLISTQVI